MRVGDEAPDFELPDQDGTTHRLSELVANGPVVLFFYPGALTPGCTLEACHFRDLAADFAAAGVQRVGISRDEVSKQKTFADRHSFDYPLLSDSDGAVVKAYGVKRSIPGLPAKRATFAIGKDQRIVAVIASEVNMEVHADKALEALASIA